jgi:hypothetical protein
MKIHRWVIRDIEASDSLEIFLVSAVSAILGIRFYLYLTDYPQIGGGGLHIAHMLWGGLLMLVAMTILMTLLNRSMHRVAALIGGLGFGTFIDELGKFITRDNNYFFEPTIAIIYVIFVTLYLLFRLIDRSISPTPKEYLINALSLVQEAIAGDLDKEEMKRAKNYLRQSGRDNERVQLVQQLLSASEVIPTQKPIFFSKLKDWGQVWYRKLIMASAFKFILISIFIIQASFAISESVIVIGFLHNVAPDIIVISENDQSFDEYGYLISVILANFFVLVGVAELFRSRLRAYQIFKIATLISLLLVQFFDFLTYQFGALWSFGYNLLVLAILNTLIENEKILEKQE